jgi:hypothetical protein
MQTFNVQILRFDRTMPRATLAAKHARSDASIVMPERMGAQVRDWQLLNHRSVAANSRNRRDCDRRHRARAAKKASCEGAYESALN